MTRQMIVESRGIMETFRVRRDYEVRMIQEAKARLLEARNTLEFACAAVDRAQGAGKSATVSSVSE